MRIFQDTFETRKSLFISVYSISMTVPLTPKFVKHPLLKAGFIVNKEKPV